MVSRGALCAALCLLAALRPSSADDADPEEPPEPPSTPKPNARTYYQLYAYRVPTYRRYRTADMRRIASYERAYRGQRLGESRRYHRRYFKEARLTGFRIQTRWQSTRECGNMEVNQYKDFMGYFSCPLYFEPRDFVYCCGEPGHHYCCSNSSLYLPYETDPDGEASQGSVVGGLLGALVLTAIIVGIVARSVMRRFSHLRNPRRNIPMTTTTTTTTSTGVPLMAQQEMMMASHAQPMMAPNVYPQPVPGAVPGVVGPPMAPVPGAVPGVVGPLMAPPQYLPVQAGQPAMMQMQPSPGFQPPITAPGAKPLYPVQQ